jgi:5S rRNA maturation endonuclease (ribonuclease M5)
MMDGDALAASAERRYTAVMRLLERLHRKADEGIPIIVEGRNDRRALKRLGIRGEIVTVKNSGKVLADLLDEVHGSRVVLFVDFDDEGVTLGRTIKEHLEERGVKVDFRLWRHIGKLLRRDVKDIEGMPSFLEKLKNWAHV